MSLLAGAEIPLACSGHILIDLPIFMGPVVVLSGWLLMVTRRARKREQLDDAPRPPLPARDPKLAETLLGLHA